MRPSENWAAARSDGAPPPCHARGTCEVSNGGRRAGLLAAVPDVVGALRSRQAIGLSLRAPIAALFEAGRFDGRKQRLGLLHDEFSPRFTSSFNVRIFADTGLDFTKADGHDVATCLLYTSDAADE